MIVSGGYLSYLRNIFKVQLYTLIRCAPALIFSVVTSLIIINIPYSIPDSLTGRLIRGCKVF